MADYAVKFDFFVSAFYFNSFHFLVIIILLSLVRGLIWEVFIVIDSIIKPETLQNQKFHLFFTKVTNDFKDGLAHKEDRELTLINNKKKDRSQIIGESYEEKSKDSIKNNTDNNQMPIIEEHPLSYDDELSRQKTVEKKESFIESNPANANLKIINEDFIEDSFDMADNNLNGNSRLLSSLYKKINQNSPFEFHIKDKKENLPIINIKHIKPNDDTQKESIHSSSPKNSKMAHEKEDKIELIKRMKKENKKDENFDSGINLKSKNVGTMFTDMEKTTIDFYKKKIKHLKYFLHLQQKQKEIDSNIWKFDENSHFFDGRDEASMKILEEFLMNNLEDDEIDDYFLPEKKDNPLDFEKTDKTYKSEKIQKKKKSPGINYGNSKEFLLKKAFLKDFNMEQIKVYLILFFRNLDIFFRNLK